MSGSDQLRKEFDDFVQLVGKPLERLKITSLSGSDLDEFIARVSFHVPPSYLPFASDDSGIFCLYTWPGIEILASPIVQVPSDSHEPRFLCDSPRTFPAAIWLWVSAYFDDDAELLRSATGELANAIAQAKSVPAALWNYLQDGPVRWSASKESSNEAWRAAGVGHPFAGMPTLTFSTKVDTALPLLNAFMQQEERMPQVVAMYLATLAKAGKPRPIADILRVLSAEAWCNWECIEGLWRVMGKGICEWDCTLRNTEDPEATFRGTPFEPLIGHPDTYSGEDKDGPKRLLAVADNFHKANDPAGELRQTRNAATLAILTAGEYPLDYAERIATVCDAIEKDSLAAALARESARVHSQGP